MKTALVCMVGFACLVCGLAVAADAVPQLPATRTIEWEKMTTPDRKRHMQHVVLPEMKKLFVAMDAVKYADMKCETCHGAKAADRNYQMPNPELVKLPPPMDRAGFAALHQKNPAMAKFMSNQVKPAMAALLGLDPWSPSNTNGFGCYACHAQVGDPKVGKEPAVAKDPRPPKGASGLKNASLLETKAAKKKAAKKRGKSRRAD